MEIDYKTDNVFHAEGWLKIVFILSTLLFIPGTRLSVLRVPLMVAVCLLAIRRQMKITKINLEVLKGVLVNEFGANLFYALFLWASPNASIIFFVPINLHFMIGAAEFIERGQPALLLRIPKVSQFAAAVKHSREHIKILRTYTELILFVYVLLLMFLRFNSFALPMMLYSYLKLKGATKVGKAALLRVRQELAAKLSRFGIVAKAVDAFLSFLIK